MLQLPLRLLLSSAVAVVVTPAVLDLYCCWHSMWAASVAADAVVVVVVVAPAVAVAAAVVCWDR